MLVKQHHIRQLFNFQSSIQSKLIFWAASVPGSIQRLDSTSSSWRILQGYNIEGAVLEQDRGRQLLQEDQVGVALNTKASVKRYLD